MDSNKLEKITANIGDMALKRRVRTVVGYLELKEEDTILDCGCGEGLYLSIINNLSNCRLYGFDFDEEALKKAKVIIRPDSVRLCRGNIYQLPYEDSSFDKIILSEVLEHLPDDLKALREVKRVLKRGGIILITVPNHNYPFFWDPINKILEVFCRRHIGSGFWAGLWNQHLRLYYPSQIRDLAEKAGLVIEKMEALTHYCFPFNHLFLYGMKQVLNKGFLPPAMSHTADKFAWSEPRQSRLIKAGYYLFNRLDAGNERIPLPKSSVAIALKARKE